MSPENYSLNQTDRHHSYDLVQKLTFFIIGAEFVFCGYLLLNAEKLSDVKHLSTLFLICGFAALFGILWRFCYNQTYHDNVHDQKSKFHGIYYRVQILSYWFYVVLTAIFFVSALWAGSIYVRKAEQNKVVSKIAVDEETTKVEKGLQTVSHALEKISKDGIIHVEVVMKDEVKNQEKNQRRP